MSKITLDEIQSRIASVVDQDDDTSNIETADYSLRLKYINMAQNEWEEANEWQVLHKTFNMLISTATGNASVALPSDFRKLSSFPKITHDGATTDEFTETLPQEAGQYNSTDKRVEMLGNYTDDMVMRIYGVALVSGASVAIPYFSSAQSLASPVDISPVPNPEYLVKRGIAYVWEAREDERFPIMKAEAEKILANMINFENVFSRAAAHDRVRTVDETRYNFKWGKD